ncbi:MAG: aldo/keto reductase [Opitutales bacterium]
MLTITSTRTLRDGHEMPLFGLGVFQMGSKEACVDGVRRALDLGYRHIDTARGYNNEDAVGEAVRASGLSREEIFVTSKVMAQDFGTAATRRAVEESLKRIDLDYIDLYLIHWPVREGTEAAWEVLCALRDEGKLKSVGVSNFTVRRYEEQFLPKVNELPVCNQIERHPFFAQNELVAFNDARDIFTVAYSPLARTEGMNHPTLQQIAAAHGKSPAQIMIRWQLQQGVGAIPKSSNPERIAENADVFDFELDTAQMTALNGLDSPEGSVISWRPEENWF